MTQLHTRGLPFACFHTKLKLGRKGRQVAGFFQRLFGSTESASPFDPEREAAHLLANLPPCTAKVVVASPKYSGKYRCEVTVDTAKLTPFVERLCQSTLGGSQQSKVGRAAFPKWLRSAQVGGTSASYLPPLFVEVVDAYVGNFVADGIASVYCIDCGRLIGDLQTETRNRKTRGPLSEWTEGWRCPVGHVLYTEDQEVHILRRREPEVASANNLTALGERVASTLAGYISQEGAASLFDPATLIVLTKDRRVFISQSSPDSLPFKADVVTCVAIKDLPAVEKCKELMGDGSHSGAALLAIDLLTRAVLAKFVLRAG